MPVSLQKGGNVSLTKEAGGNLANVSVGLGWDERGTSGADFDLDASVFAVDASGKVPGEGWFIFYQNLQSPDKTIVHTGDNLTGAGDGDDESINIDLANLPLSIEKIVVAVTIYDAASRNQNFGGVQNAFIRVCDQSGAELARYDLSEDYSLETAVIFGELYRKDNEWKLKAVGQGYNNGLEGLCADHGVGVAA